MGYVTMYIYQIVEQKRGKYFFYLKTFVAVKISLLRRKVINKDIFISTLFSNSSSPLVWMLIPGVNCCPSYNCFPSVSM